MTGESHSLFVTGGRPCSFSVSINVIGREFQTWYNYERPHSSVNHLPPGDQTMQLLQNFDSTRDVVCTTRLGGLLKSYSRRAA
ncbi:MAG: hypothetical protein CMN21_11805 [Rubinisphaera sp.]|nr:hypothetical protein [Rubinisphaera sp.]